MQSLKLLVVDDDRPIRELLAGFLTDNGYTCETADSGAQGLERVHAERFSLVITDVNMPGMTGLEMLERVRTSGNQVPAIVITASPDAVTARTVRDLGVSEVMGKPFHLVDMLSRVRDALGTTAAGQGQTALA